jgi:molybdopterin-binding protein
VERGVRLPRRIPATTATWKRLLRIEAELGSGADFAGFVGLVTEVTADKVMAQVEMRCGPYRVVSLMSTEAVEELGLAPGVLAVAVVKSTSVVVEVVDVVGQPDELPT